MWVEVSEASFLFGSLFLQLVWCIGGIGDGEGGGRDVQMHGQRTPREKQPSLHGQKFTPSPNFLGMAKAYFVRHIGPIFQISLLYAFIGCP